MRLNATRLGSIASSRSFGDQLDDLAGQVPSLDLNFAQNKSLIDDYSGTTLATHTRASSGTFVDSSGVLRSAVTNLNTNSEAFDTYGTSAGSVSANAGTAPNGTLTADEITSTGGGVFKSISGTTASTTFTVSVYAKYVSGGGLFSFGFDSNPSSGRANFNLQTGALGTADANVVSRSITPVGDGWYRCSVTAVVTSTSTIVVFYNGTSGAKWLLWGAQLEQSATVGEYIPTTSAINSAPRFDHNPTTGESLGLLVEEPRTNSVTNNTMVGAVAGTPGTLPTNWSRFFSGSAAAAVAAVGTEDGINYVDIRFSGSNNGDATSFVIDGTLGHSSTNGQTWTASAYLKLVAGSFTNAPLLLVNYEADSGAIPLAASTVSVTTVTSASLRSQRLSVTRTNNNASTALQQVVLVLTATGAYDFTIRIGLPQLEQGAFATSVIPTTSATATRAADVASITGSSFGVTRTNLSVRSEEFDNASWFKNNVITTANTAIGPSGIITADSVTPNTGTNLSYISQDATTTASTIYTWSVYVKANGFSWIFLDAYDGSNHRTWFDVTNGVIGTVETGNTSTITSVGNGWYRCTLTRSSAGGTVPYAVAVVSNNNALTVTGNSSSGIYLWGAQLEVGSAATPYIQSPSVFTSRAAAGTYVGSDGLIKTATTNEARYDHDPVSLISRGLLLEEARTNLALDSEDFSAATWTRLGTTFTVDTVASPTGATTADTLLETATTTEHILYSTDPHTFTTATHSIYVKPNGRTNVALRFYHGIDDWVVRVFSLTGNGSVTQSSAGSSSGFSAVSGSIANAGNGWYRISMTATQTSRATFAAVLDLCTSSTPTLATASGSEVYLGDVTKGVYAWGSQLEAASTASSYIPTTASTVTRAADVSTSTATSVFESSWYRQSEGTVFADARTQQSSSGHVLAGVSTGSFASSAYLSKESSNFLVAAPDAAPSSLNIGLSSVSSNVGLRAALAFTAGTGSASAVMDGGTVNTDASTGIPITMSQMAIGSAPWSIGTVLWNGTIKRLTYWPTRLSNEVLQRITQ